jgi:hypothetical protein
MLIIGINSALVLKKYFNLELSIIILLVAPCRAPVALAITISVNEWVTLIAYSNLENACTLSGSIGGSILITYDTFCIQDIVNIWKGESFLVQDKAP